MNNKYLEKIAELEKTAINRLAKEVFKGAIKGVTGIAEKTGPVMNSRGVSSIVRAGDKLSSSEIANAFSGVNKTAPVLAGGTVQTTSKGRFLGMSKGKTVTSPNLATHQSGDALATGPSLDQRLTNKKKGIFNKPMGPTSAKLADPVVNERSDNKYVNKVTGWIKSNPVTATGAGVGVGLGVGHMIGRRSNQDNRGY
jgi:hypothetical protein